MKNITYFTLLLLLCSCDGGTVRTESINTFATVIVEDCEYIYKEKIGFRSLVHKGNCKNVFHKFNTKK